MFKEHFMFVYQGFLECFISAIIVEKPHCLKTKGTISYTPNTGVLNAKFWHLNPYFKVPIS